MVEVPLYGDEGREGGREKGGRIHLVGREGGSVSRVGLQDLRQIMDRSVESDTERARERESTGVLTSPVRKRPPLLDLLMSEVPLCRCNQSYGLSRAGRPRHGVSLSWRGRRSHALCFRTRSVSSLVRLGLQLPSV